MDKRMDQIIASLNTISLEIVVPLRKKVINKAAFSELFELMNELQKILYNEKFIQKELVEILFHVYTQLDMQANYIRTEEVRKEFTAYLTKMRSKMREIFGKNVQQNANMEETSVKDIMESSGITNPQEVIDGLKKLYD
ncbi:hypothetical protein AMQ84_01265 [Paenibacillus riograndensis]|uniref:Uncharacterized protein n=1 Tax=Paenibacillus riograndensis TaxID=483937 RepID=A0A132UC69_9BACL|nr:hypothetical protein [Paenibacillus riograndensis]KWX75166.1 hypothetical protein AMQ83_36265 [Paenibacillus riograndensis]KWX81045.1 hypothetical protein AMQ84_01265 [Paenibacillus riograndensis]